MANLRIVNRPRLFLIAILNFQLATPSWPLAFRALPYDNSRP